MAGGRITLAKWVVAAALLGAFAAYLWSNKSELGRLRDISGATASYVLAARLIAYWAQVSATAQLARFYAPGLKTLEYLAVASGGSIANVVSVPGMAYGAKTLYLKSRHGIGHQTFLAITTITALFSITLGGLMALLGLAWLGGRGASINGLFWVFGSGLTLGPMLLPLFVASRPMAGLSARFAVFVESWALLVRQRRLMVSVVALLALRSAASFLGFGVLFAALAGTINSFLVGGVLDSLSMLLRVVTITPGNLGVYEWSVAGLGRGAGVSLAIGLACAALYRAAGILCVGTAGIVSVVVLGTGRLRRESRDEDA
ncbi:MAG: hypothetical protein WCF16_08625 [Alphaproteobacteria bacterium]